MTETEDRLENIEDRSQRSEVRLEKIKFSLERAEVRLASPLPYLLLFLSVSCSLSSLVYSLSSVLLGFR
jgi:hypothetical protein